jgi:hypothetical protein
MADGVFASDVITTPAVSAAGSNGAYGINATSDTGIGVQSVSFGPGDTAGVVGDNLAGGPGVLGDALGGEGVRGHTGSGNAAVGYFGKVLRIARKRN